MRTTLPSLIPVLVFAAMIMGEAAKPRVFHHGGFSIVGIEARTTNAKEMGADGIIGKQWQKFFQDGVLQKIPSKVDGNIYAVYSDYASDHNGEYSHTIGARIPDGSPVPAGLVLKSIPAGNYAVLTSEKGAVAKVVPAAWQREWDLEQKQALGGMRAYKADYELYDQRAADPANSQVDLYIGLK